jgi:hypothetical protein
MRPFRNQFHKSLDGGRVGGSESVFLGWRQKTEVIDAMDQNIVWSHKWPKYFFNVVIFNWLRLFWIQSCVGAWAFFNRQDVLIHPLQILVSPCGVRKGLNHRQKRWRGSGAQKHEVREFSECERELSECDRVIRMRERVIRMWERVIRMWEKGIRMWEKGIRMWQRAIRMWERVIRMWERVIRMWEKGIRMWESYQNVKISYHNVRKSYQNVTELSEFER